MKPKIYACYVLHDTGEETDFTPGLIAGVGSALSQHQAVRVGRT